MLTEADPNPRATPPSWSAQMAEIARRVALVFGLTGGLYLWWQTHVALWVWLMLGAALALYMLVPWPRFDERTARLSRWRSVWAGDAGGIAMMVLGSVFVHGTTPQGAWTGLISAVGGACVGLPWFMWAARNAAYAVRAESDRLVVTSWRGRDDWVFCDVRQVTALVVRGRRRGVVLRDVSGEELRLDWTWLVRADRVQRTLESAGLSAATRSSV